MNPKPPSPVILPTGVTAAVVRQLDEQLLRCVEEESLSSAQQAELLAWAHGHLLCAYVAVHLDAFVDPSAEPAQELPIKHCTSAIEIIGNMLSGGIPLEEDMTFHCPPVCCACARALHAQLPAWVRRRVELAAQRTRWHTEAELTQLWEAVEMHLVVGSIAWFDLAEQLGGDLPAIGTVEAKACGCLEAMHVGRGLSWSPGGAVLG